MNETELKLVIAEMAIEIQELKRELKKAEESRALWYSECKKTREEKI